MQELRSYPVDEVTRSIFLELPVGHIILFQALIDTYEGIGVVRTIRPDSSIVCIITTVDMEPALREVLEDVQPQFLWRCVVPEPDYEVVP